MMKFKQIIHGENHVDAYVKIEKDGKLVEVLDPESPEREPVINNPKLRYDMAKRKVEYLRTAIETRVKDKEFSDAKKLYPELEKAMREFYPLKRRRVVLSWLIGSGLGIIICASLNIGFLAKLGFSMEGALITNPYVDYFITGLLVGSGTQQLHNLIKYIEKAT